MSPTEREAAIRADGEAHNAREMKRRKARAAAQERKKRRGLAAAIERMKEPRQ
jgi:hypothetical protein